MEYLGSQHIIHGDLSTRNILVRTPVDIEVTDFGLANFAGDNTIPNPRSGLPWPWMAPEILDPSPETLTFTVQTDIWAFGVTAWEIFTFGSEPYLEMQLSSRSNGRKRLYEHLKGGERLGNPEVCGFALRWMLQSCKLIHVHLYIRNFAERRTNFFYICVGYAVGLEECKNCWI